ncbi:MAG TPA: glycosyltransferase [Phycisphaerales bacterium]|nr:glycosyltransferase [Phycisphaerales bacterium]
MPPRILILSASVGAGHIRAAQALELTLKSLSPEPHVRNVDILDHATAAFRRIYAKSYFDLVNKAPHLLGWIYDFTDTPTTANRTDRFRLLLQRLNLRGINKLLLGDASPSKTRSRFKRRRTTSSSAHASSAWDCILCTHFLPAEIIARLRRKKLWPDIPVHTIVTDFDAHGMWVNHPIGSTDRFFVATDDAALSLQRFNVPASQIQITGIPIHPDFSKPCTVQAARKKLDLPTNRHVILLLAGGFGLGPIQRLFESALQTKLSSSSRTSQGIHLCVIAGKNEKLKRSLEKTAVPHPHSATIVGFTTEMDQYMAAADLVVSKPGGLTTSEVLARGAAMVIVNPIPGQESRNSDFLLENGAAVKINSADALPHKLALLLSNPQRLASLRAAARRLGRPNAAIEIVNTALTTQA